MKRYVIFSAKESKAQGEAMYWSNADGWGDVKNATVFTAKEKRGLSLPAPDGRWKEFEGLDIAGYLGSDGMFCPYCGSNSIEGLEWDPPSQEVHCNSCEQTWRDVYKLTDVEAI